jgi:glutamate-1-semialdehyde aminotransferase
LYAAHESFGFIIMQDRLWKNAVKLMPRGTQTMSKCPDQFVDGVFPKFADNAKGAHIFDIEGNKYLDYMCGLGPIILGYNHDRTNRAIKDQLEKGIIFSLPTLLEQELAQIMIDIIPCAEQVRFAKNGTDADLAAVRIARSYTGKEHIAKCGYHGWGDWHAASIRKLGVPTSLESIVHEFKYNDLQSLEDILKKHETAAVIMEPQALTLPDAGFLEGVRSLCDKYSALLIFDEVITGFRWGIGGAQKIFGVTPDLACFGKSMANGMPISAICGKKEFMKELDFIFFSMTFGGECLSLAAAIETIKELKEKDYSHIWDIGKKFKDGIDAAAIKNNLKINLEGSPPRHSLSFSQAYKDPAGMKALFCQEMVKRNILFTNVMYKSFAHTSLDIEKTVIAAQESFEIVERNKNQIDKVLLGKRPIEIFRKNT